MKYRLTVIFLASLLFASFSFNLLHYDALIRAESMIKLDAYYNQIIIDNFVTQLNEVTE